MPRYSKKRSSLDYTSQYSIFMVFSYFVLLGVVTILDVLSNSCDYFFNDKTILGVNLEDDLTTNILYQKADDHNIDSIRISIGAILQISIKMIEIIIHMVTPLDLQNALQ